jgi:DNA-binding HxlR family transcriptional regulator
MAMTTTTLRTAALEPRAGEPSAYEEHCANYPHHAPAVRGVLERIGDKWSLLVSISLERGPLRYGALKRQVVGVSQRMPTLTLRQLERDGLVARTIYPEIPPRVEYELTVLGRTLIAPARCIAHWAIANYGAIEESRARFDQAAETGDPR